MELIGEVSKLEIFVLFTKCLGILVGDVSLDPETKIKVMITCHLGTVFVRIK